MRTRLQAPNLIRRWLLDLAQQVRLRKRGRRVSERRSDLLIGRIGEPGGAACSSLHYDLHTPFHESGHAIWYERDAVFAGGALFGNSDDHGDWTGRRERGCDRYSHKVRIVAPIGKRRNP